MISGHGDGAVRLVHHHRVDCLPLDQQPGRESPPHPSTSVLSCCLKSGGRRRLIVAAWVHLGTAWPGWWSCSSGPTAVSCGPVLGRPGLLMPVDGDISASIDVLAGCWYSRLAIVQIARMLAARWFAVPKHWLVTKKKQKKHVFNFNKKHKEHAVKTWAFNCESTTTRNKSRVRSRSHCLCQFQPTTDFSRCSYPRSSLSASTEWYTLKKRLNASLLSEIFTQLFSVILHSWLLGWVRPRAFIPAE